MSYLLGHVWFENGSDITEYELKTRYEDKHDLERAIIKWAEGHDANYDYDAGVFELDTGSDIFFRACSTTEVRRFTVWKHRAVKFEVYEETD